MGAFAYQPHPEAPEEDRRRAQPRLFALPGGAEPAADEVVTTVAPLRPVAVAEAPTLDDVLSGAWGVITAGSEATCPVCTGSLQPRWSAGSGVVGSRCSDCGSTLD